MPKPSTPPKAKLCEQSGPALQWRVHTPSLLSEISQCSGQAALTTPLRIFGNLLAEVGERAAELDDPKLNALMCRLTIYTISDPYDPSYDQKRTEAIIAAVAPKREQFARWECPTCGSLQDDPESMAGMETQCHNNHHVILGTIGKGDCWLDVQPVKL